MKRYNTGRHKVLLIDKGVNFGLKNYHGKIEKGKILKTRAPNFHVLFLEPYENIDNYINSSQKENYDCIITIVTPDEVEKFEEK